MSVGGDQVAFESWKFEKCSYGGGEPSYAPKWQAINVVASPLESQRGSGDGCRRR